MKDKCPKCGKTINRSIGNYEYKESGLDNVFLENVPIYECTCGISYPSIFRVPRLNELIARTLLEKPALLNGKEIRFLRKNLYLSSTAFSETLSVGKDTLSKWENDIQQHSEQNDLLIRAAYIILKGITDKDTQKLFKYLARIRLKKPDFDSLIIAEKLKDDYIVNWKPVVGSQAEKSVRIWVSPQKLFQAVTCHGRLVVGQSQTESDVQFFSPEVLSTKTSSYCIMLEGR